MQLVVESGWNLNQGLELVRALQPKIKEFGYHVTLGGGVLNNGKSKKDIDLYFIPLVGKKFPIPDSDKLIAWFTGLWGDGVKLGDKKLPPGHYDPHQPGTSYYNSTSGTLSDRAPDTYGRGWAGPGMEEWWYLHTTVQPGGRYRPYPGWNSSPEVAGFENVVDYETNDSTFKHKMKYKYGEERIDVFIL